MPRSSAAAFKLEEARRDAAPLYSAVFHFGGTIGDVYLADRETTIGGHAHRGPVVVFGTYQELVAAADGKFQIGTMPIEIINTPIFGSPPQRFSALMKQAGTAGIEVDVYQNLQKKDGTILQEPFHSFVARITEPYDQYRIKIDLESISEKYLTKKELSWLITRTNCPFAANDVIGQRANVVVGAAKRIKAQAVVAGPWGAVRAAMTGAQTTVPIYDDLYDAIVAPGTIRIYLADHVTFEDITYTGKGGSAGSRTLTGAVRAQNGTFAWTHGVDETIQQLLTTCAYMVNGEKGKAIKAVYVKKGSTIVLAPSATFNTSISDSALVPGHTVARVTFTKPAREYGKYIVEQLNVSGSVVSPIGPASRTIVCPVSFSPITFYAFDVTWSVNGQNFTSLTLTIEGVTVYHYDTTSGLTVYVNPITVTSVDPFILIVLAGTFGSGGGASFNATVTKASYYRNTSMLDRLDSFYPDSATALIGDEVLVDIDGAPDDGAGTYTGSANALIEKAPDVLHYLARALSGVPVGRTDVPAFQAARAALPSYYKFAGNLIERSALPKELLLALGLQCRLQVDWPVDKLTVREVKSSYAFTLFDGAAKILTEANVVAERQGNGQNRSTLKIVPGDDKEVINCVTVLYKRDWSKSRGKDAFNGATVEARDAASTAKYGERKQAERFWMDFISDATMAAELRDFFLARLKEAPRRATFDCKLDQFEVLNGDVIGLRYFAQKQGTGVGIAIPTGGVIVPSGGIVVLGGTGLPGEIFEFDGTQKLLVEQFEQKYRPRRMALRLKEVP